MTISVIITAYNIEKYIPQCLESIMNQTYRDLEIIVVNDGSVDNTADILQEYQQKDARIKIITQENKGGGPARNAGLEVATGEYVAILDGDDFFELAMLEKAVERAIETNADIVIYDAKFYDNETGNIGVLEVALKKEFVPQKTAFSWEDVPDKIFNISDGFVWNKLYKRKFIEENHLRFQDVRRIDDLLFEMKALIKAERISVLPEYFVFYRCNNPTSQQGCATATSNTFFIAFKAVKDWLVEEGVYEKVAQSFANRAILSCKSNLDLMKTGAAFESQYLRIKNEYFDELGIVSKEGYYYNSQLDKWMQNIKQYTPTEYLYRQLDGVKHSYGISDVEFRISKQLIPAESKVIIYGAGNVGRAYYLQLLVSQYWEVVMWADRNYERIGWPVESPERIKDKEFDYLLIAVENKNVAEKIRADLESKGIAPGKIIWAMSEKE